MTRVSSESKSPEMRQEPRAKAANNKTRLEMLLEPGNTISP